MSARQPPPAYAEAPAGGPAYAKRAGRPTVTREILSFRMISMAFINHIFLSGDVNQVSTQVNLFSSPENFFDERILLGCKILCIVCTRLYIQVRIFDQYP